MVFSDLVGSTALSARMDPEDLREVISTYQKCVAETVQKATSRACETMRSVCFAPVNGRRLISGRV